MHACIYAHAKIDIELVLPSLLVYTLYLYSIRNYIFAFRFVCGYLVHLLVHMHVPYILLKNVLLKFNVFCNYMCLTSI